MPHSAERPSSARPHSIDEPVLIRIASDFSETPSDRRLEDGGHSGQRFREEFLLPRLRQGRRVVLDIDGVTVLPSSFWEEALGGSVRSGVGGAEMRRLVSIETSQRDLQTYVRTGWMHVDEAEKGIASVGRRQ